jgi:hypothetical protein
MPRRTKPAAAAAGVLPLALSFLGNVGVPTTTPTAESIAKPAGIEAIYPDRDRTPGAPNAEITQDNIADNLCSKSWSTTMVRPPTSYTNPLKLKQLKEYDDTVSDEDAACMAGSDNPKCYEEDHLISLENGGDPRDPQNLWPEPYYTTVGGQTMGARQKDTVEGFIHDEICYAIPNSKKNSRIPAHSSITLARGQEILATDWYACYLSIQQGKDCN